jgi:ferritin-like metal-binding protein YciE
MAALFSQARSPLPKNVPQGRRVTDLTEKGDGNMAHKDLLIAWLNDAYAMEKALIPILENHAKDAKDHPDVRARIEQHAEQTRRHAEMVEQCVKSLGSSTSATKTTLGTVFGAMQSVATGMFSDELVKNALMDYAAENFEIASYQALIVAAEEYGDDRIVEICEEILDDEIEMAEWLEEQLPITVREVYREKATEH